MYSSDTGKSEEQVVVFNLHNQTYGVNIASVLEIIRAESVTRIPGSPIFIEGIINIRGKVIPVMDLCKRFGLPSGAVSETTRIIIVEAGGVSMGFTVDSVSEVIRLPDTAIEPVPSLISTASVDAFRGIALVGDRLITLLDINKLLCEDEKEELLGFEG
ncbi:MAG: chemotaxis protein CheW [Peptococcaceae bacterium BICA1-7]|nr:MAG: chemotaxis protein CheW [Peptococcaceae bacterium BICA1-7]HBV96571.1 chemotaxis protein CheW [Desulfotomaculum sp.]